MPPADVLPRAAWADEVLRMQRIRDGSEATATPSATLPADFLDALEWYETRAPLTLARPADWPAPDARSLVISRLTPPGAPPRPWSPTSRWPTWTATRASSSSYVTCGTAWCCSAGRTIRPPGSRSSRQVPHPSRAQVVDLDGDGVRDVLVADLGEFLPRDHDKGAVVWLRGLGEGRFAPFAIGGLPRIASVEAADLDADGDKDLVVAAFGYRKTGSVLVLENRTTDWARPAFSPVTLDARPGAVRALSTDINHDGRLDVVAVVSHRNTKRWSPTCAAMGCRSRRR